MSAAEKLKKDIYNALKISGFNVRREFCSLIVDKFLEEGIKLSDRDVFDSCVDKLCRNFESQCSSEKSIEREQIERAIEACLHAGYDKHETVFNVIDAFSFPKLKYNLDRKLFFIDKKKSKLLSDGDSKAEMFLERYSTILQRTRRNFSVKQSASEREKLQLQTVDYLLTSSYVTLDRTLILGSLLQVSEGKYHLEDPTGSVLLDLTHAKYHGGFFPENMFVLVNGYYEDKILHASTIILPPGEEYSESRSSFGSLNYFGGSSNIPLKDSLRLQEHLENNPHDMIMFFSDVWLDNPMTLEKLEVLFNGLHESPPIAFVFIGDFMSETYGSEMLENMRKLFRQFAELISRFPNLIASSNFVFVPGINDPTTPFIVPRFPLPQYVTAEITKVAPKAIFTTNPCRIQYCTREITIFRADMMGKLLQGTLHKPKKDELAECITRTIVSQAHLSPMSLNALTVHWDFDYTLRLYPLPDLVVIGDRSEAYEGKHKGCQVINPGPFCDSGFQFKSYTPANDTVDDCVL